MATPAPAPVPHDRSVLSALSLSNPSILVIAHRGVFDRAPENSLGAVERAVALGVDMAEIDVQTSADGVLVAIHDDTLDRTTTGSGPVRALDARTLRDLRLREGDGGPRRTATPERLPLLADILEAARGRIFLNIDAKYRDDLPAIAALVRDRGMADEVLVKSEVDPSAFRAPSTESWRLEGLPFMPMFKLRRERAAADIARVAANRPPVIECHFDHVDALSHTFDARRAAGIRLWVNSLDCSHSLDFNDTNALAEPERIWGALLAAGVGAIQTDRAEALIAWLGKRHGGAAR